ncbi:ssk1 response regulator receiver [Linnemannia hyalina]|uniref:Ssk1 response regulator receiver n=1 Tax=Linnemannia hyalina TaxID=64524 RepID=A0A9P7XGB0_9FUNG|nr:ssk1 response regulator receiver [Linnemannia hyalina]
MDSPQVPKSTLSPAITTDNTPDNNNPTSTTTALPLSDNDNDNTNGDDSVPKEHTPATPAANGATAPSSSSTRVRSTAPRFKMQSRPAQLIRNLHANYFTPPSSFTDCPSFSSPEATTVGKVIQSIRHNLFAFGAIVSVAGCAILIGHGRTGLYLHGIGHSGLLAQAAYQGLFAVACSWQWLKPMWSSSPSPSPSSSSPRSTSHLSGIRSDDTSSPLDTKPAEPTTNASEPSITNNSKSATLDQASTSNPAATASTTATSTAAKATTSTTTLLHNTTSSSSISTSSRSSFPYWVLGYGLLGLVGLTPALTSHGWHPFIWNPAIILSTLVPLFLAPALLGLDRISAALSEDTDRHNAELDELQERHEILMEAYRDENLLKKNILLETVGKEVQDAATLAIETLRQMTPTSLFPPSVSREQLSPCTLPIPITSVLGLFTTMRHLQYISRNMQRLSRVMFTEYVQGIVEKTSPHYHRGENGFDVGEFVQSLGDLVSADASLKGVEFVIYHSEYGLSHVPIKGSEESWRHALINLIKSIIDSAKSGSTVELCLVLFALPQPEVEKNKVMVTFEIIYYPNHASTSNEDDLAQLNALLASKLVKAMGGALEIQALEDFAKKFIVSVEVEMNQSGLLQDEKSASTTAINTPKSGQDSPSLVHPLDPAAKPDEPLQPIPIQGHLQRLENMQTKYPMHESQQFFQQHLKTPLVSPSPSPSSPPSKRGAGSPKTSTEPTVQELLRFSRKLGGLKVVMMAREHSAFGVRLLGYLKTWGIHVTTKTIRDADGTEGEGESESEFTTEDPQTPTGAAQRTNSSSSLNGKPSDASGKIDASSALKSVGNPAFIMIDDDVRVLGQQILKLQATPPSPGPGSTTPKGRPTHRRHKSITSIQHTSIIYFTSLPTFKQARDTITFIIGTQMPGVHYSFANSLAGPPPSQGPLPYILVLPKPAGPRRVLTAIHTAINVPVLDQTYSPIATAPTSPAPMVRHFSTEINPFDRDRICYDPISHQAYAQTTLHSTQSSPGSISPNHPLTSDQRHRREMRQYAEPGGSGGMATYSSESQSLGGIVSPETPGGPRFIASPNGMPVTASGNQLPGILFDPTASRPQGTLSPSPGGPGQRRVSNGSARYSSHGSEGSAYVIPPAAGIVQHQPFSAMHAQRTADSAVAKAHTLSPDPAPTTTSQSALPAGYIRFSNGQVMRPGTRSPLTTPPMIIQSPGILFSPPTTRHSGMSSPLPQRSTDPLTPRGESGGTHRIIGSDSPKGSHPVLHGLPSPLAVSAAGTILRNSPGGATSSSSFPSHGTSPLPNTSETTANRTRSGSTPAKKAKDTGAKATTSLVKSGVVERVSPLVNVLIVEDNMINQTILIKFMQRRKIKFDVACNGREAVDKWRVGGFHLVLMDIQMPVMDGIEATREIRQLEKAQRIGVFPTDKPNSIGNTMSLMAASASASSSATSPQGATTPSSPFRSPVIIVALTASAESEESRNTALLAGCNDYITKPIDLPWLERKIVEWGCMQALIDVDAWKEWKRDLDGTTPGSPSAGPSVGGTVGASAALKQSLASAGKLTQASLRRPSSTRWTKGNKAAAAAAAAAVAAKNAVADADAAAGSGPDNGSPALTATKTKTTPKSAVSTAAATLTKTTAAAGDAVVPVSRSSPGTPLTTTSETTSAVQSDSSALVPDEDSPHTVN